MLSTYKDLEAAVATGKPIKYTYGFKYRGPTTYEVPITTEQALEIGKKNSIFEVIDKGDWIDFNAYSANDMW